MATIVKQPATQTQAETGRAKEKPSALRSIIAGATAGAVEICMLFLISFSFSIGVCLWFWSGT